MQTHCSTPPYVLQYFTYYGMIYELEFTRTTKHPRAINAVILNIYSACSSAVRQR